MLKRVAIFNQKGGVGKTTVTVNLAVGLARRKKGTLIVDLDPQGNTTSGFGKVASEKGSIYEVFRGEAEIEDILLPIEKNLDLIPSSRDLAAFSMEQEEKSPGLLIEKLEPIFANYDYILIDCPPSLGLLSLNALVAAHSVLIPIQCEYYALEGLSQLMETMEMMQRGLNPGLYLEGVLLNMVDKRNNLTKDVAMEVRRFFKDKVYQTEIPRNVRLAEAPSYGMSIYDYDNLSRGSMSFKKWVKEFIKRSETWQKKEA
ncbi:MAG: ParA family protein [Tissierellia bacterium]|nr:ParA family protein [Tissierellia bacterium]